jgi:glycosyltransferase 2 family protein
MKKARPLYDCLGKGQLAFVAFDSILNDDGASQCDAAPAPFVAPVFSYASMASLNIRETSGWLRDCHIDVSHGPIEWPESAGAESPNPGTQGFIVLKDHLPRATSGRKAWPRRLCGVAASLAIAAVAIYALTHAIKKLDLAKVMSIAQATDSRLIALALALVAMSYASLTLYDLLALRTIGRSDIPYRMAALASFTSYPIAHGIGAVALIAPVIRYRIYSRYELRAIDIANISVLTGLTFWLGNLTALGLSLMLDPEAFGWVEYWPPTLNRAVATTLLAGVLAFAVWSWPGRRSKRWRMQLPRGPLVLLQIVVGLFDLGTVALAMYVLIPAGLNIELSRLTAVFIAATLLGFASHAPAGIGVFDATLLLGLGGDDKEPLIAALLIFRVLYHLLPLVAALALFGSVEAWRSLRTVAPLASSGRGVQLQADHAGDDQTEADQSDGVDGFAVQQHAGDDAADRADAGPYRVSGAKRK